MPRHPPLAFALLTAIAVIAAPRVCRADPNEMDPLLRDLGGIRSFREGLERCRQGACSETTWTLRYTGKLTDNIAIGVIPADRFVVVRSSTDDRVWCVRLSADEVPDHVVVVISGRDQDEAKTTDDPGTPLSDEPRSATHVPRLAISLTGMLVNFPLLFLGPDSWVKLGPAVAAFAWSGVALTQADFFPHPPWRGGVNVRGLATAGVLFVGGFATTILSKNALPGYVTGTSMVNLGMGVGMFSWD